MWHYWWPICSGLGSKLSKNVNGRLFDLMSGVNETTFLVQQESFDCKCGLNESVCNSKQKWNHDEYRCECHKIR